jgi:peptidyl-prolyl cis-trans isomerase D
VGKELAMSEAEKRAQTLFYNLILETGEPFRNLAAQFSDDSETKSQGGDLGFYQGGSKGRVFDQAAFSLEEGEISQPVRLGSGYAIIQVEERIPRRPMTYEESQDRIREKFVDADFEEAKNALAKKLEADIVVDEPNLRVVSDYLLEAADDNLLRTYMVR